MAHTIRHLTGAAKPGQPNDRAPAPAGPPPPRWRMWLLPVGIFITLLLFLDPSHVEHDRPRASPIRSSCPKSPRATSARRRSTPAAPSPARSRGATTTRARSRRPSTTHQLAPTLKAHHVDVTGVGAGLGPPDRSALLPSPAALRRLLHLDRAQERQAARRGDHGLRRVRRPRSTTRRSPPPASPTSPATRGPSERWPRSSTS